VERIIAVTPDGVIDTLTGELSANLELENLLLERPGGIIAGINLYPTLAALVPELRKDEGWSMQIQVEQKKPNPDNKRVMGNVYVSRLTYRPAKERDQEGKRRRPPAIKWMILNLELFIDIIQPYNVMEVAQSLVGLAGRRGIKLRPSPGSLGSALLRASPEWSREKRQPAPWFISQLAREHLPGNHYKVSSVFSGKPIPHCYYLDQESSHHKISSSIPLPHPSHLRARGYLRAAENEMTPRWAQPSDLKGHVGLLYCVIESGMIPPKLEHLYPPWALQRGRSAQWVWTPELPFFQHDHRLHLSHIVYALTSHKPDTALWEYADWALEQRERPDKQTIKSSLLAAYGMLACRTDRPLEVYSVHGRKKPPRAELCDLPLLPNVYRSTVKRKRIPSIQNVIARGVRLEHDLSCILANLSRKTSR
jgi:hypothetical protein